MKRAVATHEATLIVVNVLILQETLQWYDDWNSSESSKEIVEVIKLAKDLTKAKQPKKIREPLNKISSILINL